MKLAQRLLKVGSVNPESRAFIAHFLDWMKVASLRVQDLEDSYIFQFPPDEGISNRLSSLGAVYEESTSSWIMSKTSSNVVPALAYFDSVRSDLIRATHDKHQK